MVRVWGRKCRNEGCGKCPVFGMAGTKTAEYCVQHAPGGMVNVWDRKCKSEGCGKQPSFGVAGTKTVEYCAQHASAGMVNVRNRKSRTEGFGKRPSLGVAGTKTAEYGSQHAPDAMINVRSSGKFSSGEYRKRETFPPHSTEETIVNSSPGGVKRKTVYSTPDISSAPSNGSRDYRRRARQRDIVSAAASRALAGESAAGSVTMPVIDRQQLQSPVTRDSSVKTEVQLSL
ncbi:unnamed protein product [Ascophyllum nodosum]